METNNQSRSESPVSYDEPMANSSDSDFSTTIPRSFFKQEFEEEPSPQSPPQSPNYGQMPSDDDEETVEEESEDDSRLWNDDLNIQWTGKNNMEFLNPVLDMNNNSITTTSLSNILMTAQTISSWRTEPPKHSFKLHRIHKKENYWTRKNRYHFLSGNQGIITEATISKITNRSPQFRSSNWPILHLTDLTNTVDEEGSPISEFDNFQGSILVQCKNNPKRLETIEKRRVKVFLSKKSAHNPYSRPNRFKDALAKFVKESENHVPIISAKILSTYHGRKNAKTETQAPRETAPTTANCFYNGGPRRKPNRGDQMACATRQYQLNYLETLKDVEPVCHQRHYFCWKNWNVYGHQ